MASAKITPGTGKLKGRFCVRVHEEGSKKVKFQGCFKSQAAAKERADKAEGKK